MPPPDGRSPPRAPPPRKDSVYLRKDCDAKTATQHQHPERRAGNATHQNPTNHA